MTLRRKLLQRVMALPRAAVRSLLRVAASPKAIQVEAQHRYEALRGNRAQWRRWYQANTKRQRQLSALKRMGVRIDPNSTGLKRWVVA